MDPKLKYCNILVPVKFLRGLKKAEADLYIQTSISIFLIGLKCYAKLIMCFDCAR